MIQKSAMRVYIQYLLLLATNRAKAVRELTWHESEKTSEVSEQDVGETIRRRNDRKHVPRERKISAWGPKWPLQPIFGAQIFQERAK